MNGKKREESTIGRPTLAMLKCGEVECLVSLIVPVCVCVCVNHDINMYMFVLPVRGLDQGPVVSLAVCVHVIV